jgi:hypothetical protein
MINFISTSFTRMKHSNIIYDPLTKMTLIDNSLIKALEIAQARKMRIKKNKELATAELATAELATTELATTELATTEKQKSFEMSESHECKPFFKK